MALFSNKIKITNFQLSSTQPQYTNRAWSGTQITRSTGIQYYELTFTLNFNQRDQLEVKNFIAQYSQSKPFSINLGMYGQYTGNQASAVSTQSSAAMGSYQVSTNQNSLEIGTLIQFQNHAKIYRIIANTGTTISLFPNLRNTVQVGENIKYQNIEGSFVLNADNDYQIQIQSAMTLQLKATENI